MNLNPRTRYCPSSVQRAMLCTETFAKRPTMLANVMTGPTGRKLYARQIQNSWHGIAASRSI